METVIETLEALIERGIIEDYAISGASGALFYAEPIDTSDIDVLVYLPHSDSLLITLAPIYEVLRAQGYKEEEEHIIIDGIPVQFLPVYDSLTESAIDHSLNHVCGRRVARVVDPEHLVIIALNTGRRKDYLRIDILLEQADLDLEYLGSLLEIFGLLEKFNQKYPRCLEKFSS